MSASTERSPKPSAQPRAVRSSWATPRWPNRFSRAPRHAHPLGYYARVGFERLSTTVHSVRHFRQLVRFLGVFFLFSMGLTSIIAFVSVYAERTIRLSIPELLGLLLVLQVSAAGGAIGFTVKSALGSPSVFKERSRWQASW